MPDVVRMMAIAFVMMDGWVHTVKMFVQKVSYYNLKINRPPPPKYQIPNLFFFFISFHWLHIGFYGKHCMEFCSCASPQFVCHAAHGCVCRVGFSGTDCLTPRGQFQELNGGIIFWNYWNLKIEYCQWIFQNCNFDILRYLGQSSASIAWGVFVALSVGIIVFILLYYRRSVRNLKTEIAHVQYIADPPSQPDQHHFDNPVYAFQPSTSTPSDSSTLLYNLQQSQKPSNLGRGKFANKNLCNMNKIPVKRYNNFPFQSYVICS